MARQDTLGRSAKTRFWLVFVLRSFEPRGTKRLPSSLRLYKDKENARQCLAAIALQQKHYNGPPQTKYSLERDTTRRIRLRSPDGQMLEGEQNQKGGTVSYKAIVPPEFLGNSEEFSLFIEAVKAFGLEGEFFGKPPLSLNWGKEEQWELQKLVILRFSENPILELPFPEEAPETKPS